MNTGPAGKHWDTPYSVDLSNTDLDVSAVLRALLDQAAAGSPSNIGFPGAVDIDYEPVLPLFKRLFNNVGDPGTPPAGAAHTNALERSVITWCADLVGLPPDDRWGYVTAGGTEGNLAALHAARHRYPGALVYTSRAAHYSIAKVLDILGAETELVDVDQGGEMDYRHLARLIGRHRDRPAIVVATLGTTMTEAIDRPDLIHEILDAHHVPGRHLHADAALDGFPLALDGVLRMSPDTRIDSVAISGHKFFGTPVPCGVVLMRDAIRRQARHIAYTATLDSTVSGSRSGQAAALLWYAIATHGRAGHQARAARARALAAYTTDQLTAIGWPAWRHPHAFTVVLRTPPPDITRKWILATDGPWCHTICTPGNTRAQMDAFVSDLQAVARDADAA